jgi:hypothetical protein
VARRPPSRPRRRSIDLLLLLIIAGAALLGPRLVDGLAALEWTRYYARHGADTRPWDLGHKAGRSAARAIERLAPLPQAAEAAHLAMGIGQLLEDQNPAAALTLYTQLRSALERTQSSRVQGLGLAAVSAEAKTREETARARAQAVVKP